LKIKDEMQKAVPTDSSVDNESQSQIWKHFFAGATAGIISRTVTAPIDRLKIFSQVHGKSYGIYSGLKWMVNEGGYLSLWRGNGVSLLKVGPETASKFVAYNEIKSFLKGNDRTSEFTIFERLLAGAFSGCISQSCVYPLEVIKTRMAIKKTIDNTTIASIVQNGYKQQGISFFFKGYLSTLLGISVFTAVDLSTYESMKMLLKSTHGNLPPQVIFGLSGISACLVGQLISYPLSMLGTAMQASDDSKRSQRSSWFYMFQSRYKARGIQGLYAGCMVTYLKALPSMTITYLIYEEILIYLGAYMF